MTFKDIPTLLFFPFLAFFSVSSLTVTAADSFFSFLGGVEFCGAEVAGLESQKSRSSKLPSSLFSPPVAMVT